MKGNYEIKINDVTISLNREQIEEITRYGIICKIEENIPKNVNEEAYKKEDSFKIAERAYDIANNPIKYFNPYIKIAAQELAKKEDCYVIEKEYKNNSTFFIFTNMAYYSAFLDFRDISSLYFGNDDRMRVKRFIKLREIVEKYKFYDNIFQNVTKNQLEQIVKYELNFENLIPSDDVEIAYDKMAFDFLRKKKNVKRHTIVRHHNPNENDENSIYVIIQIECEKSKYLIFHNQYYFKAYVKVMNLYSRKRHQNISNFIKKEIEQKRFLHVTEEMLKEKLEPSELFTEDIMTTISDYSEFKQLSMNKTVEKTTYIHR